MLVRCESTPAINFQTIRVKIPAVSSSKLTITTIEDSTGPTVERVTHT